MPEEEPKKGIGTYKSIFSMGQYDMERYNEIFKSVDRWSIELKAGNMDAARPLYACLEDFYDQMRELVKDKIGTEKLFTDADKTITNIERFGKSGRDVGFMLPKVKEDMRILVRRIAAIKQMVGLGIEVEKKLSLKKKWERAARIGG